MREKFNALMNDYYQLGMIILDLLLLISMKFNSDFQLDYFTYFSIISRFLFPFIVLIFGNKGIWGFYFITACVKTLDITFDDFTALSVFCILFLFLPKENKKLKIATLIIYLIGIFTVASLHEKHPYHLFAHFIGCSMLVLTVYKLRYKSDTRIIIHADKLDLKHDEILILQELIKGKHQKEINLFSANTVTNKLKLARQRNNINSTDELLKRFSEEITLTF